MIWFILWAMTNDELSYYRAAGPLTRITPECTGLLSDLPSDIPGLCEVVQGVVMHPDLAGLYQLDVATSRKEDESELRPVAGMLARIRELDPRPLVHERPTERRLLGTCRSFATLLCGLLRFQGIPARSRCGFARYFVPGRAEDHWVCEVWRPAEERWVLVDAQVDDVQRTAFGISIDTLDVSREVFVTGGQAWRECRSGEAAWSDFGLSVIHESGLWWVLSNFIKDIAALNKLEFLPWDEWGLMLKDVGGDPYAMEADELLSLLAPDDLSDLDRIATLSSRDVSCEGVQRAFEDHGRFGLSGRVRSARRGVVDLESLLGLGRTSPVQSPTHK